MCAVVNSLRSAETWAIHGAPVETGGPGGNPCHSARTTVPAVESTEKSAVAMFLGNASVTSESSQAEMRTGFEGVTSWFGSAVTAAFCRSVMGEYQQQAIGELESFAVLVAVHLWGQKLARKHVLVFLDYEACRFLILRGYVYDFP
eukprot:s1130_g34.t1